MKQHANSYYENITHEITAEKHENTAPRKYGTLLTHINLLRLTMLAIATTLKCSAERLPISAHFEQQSFAQPR